MKVNVLVADSNTIPSTLPLEVMRKSIENKNLLLEKNSMYIGTGNVDDIFINGTTYSVAQTGALLTPNIQKTSVLLSYKDDASDISINWGTPSFSQINQDPTIPLEVEASGILSALGINQSQLETLQKFLSLLTIDGNTLTFNWDIAANEFLLNKFT